MDVEKKQALTKDDKKNKNYYEVVSKVLTFVDKVDKINNKKKKGDNNGN